MGAGPLLEIPYRQPLLPGILLGRYKRFLADVRLEGCGTRVTAHCVNTGRMEGLTKPGRRVWLSHDPEKKGRLKYTWEITEVDGQLTGTNTAMPNRIAAKLLDARLIRGLTRWEEMRAEKSYANGSRMDFWLREGLQEHYVEVKNCHLVYPDGRGYFPDSKSDRAAKHMRELMEAARKGIRAWVIFTVQRTDVRAVRPSDVHDPAFSDAAREAAGAGVTFLAFQVRPTPERLIVERRIPVDLRSYPTVRQAQWREELRAQAPAWFTNPPEELDAI